MFLLVLLLRRALCDLSCTLFPATGFFRAHCNRLGSSLILVLGTLIVILLEPLFREQVALSVELKTVLLKEEFWFLLEQKSLTILLEPALTWMVSCTGESLKVQTAFLDLYRLSLLQEALWQKKVLVVIPPESFRCLRFPPQLLLLELVCCGRLVEDTLLIAMVALVQASLPADRVSSA